MAQRGPGQVRSNNLLARQILGEEAYGRESKDARGMVDISQLQSGQNGFQTDFTGYVNNSSYVRRNIICALVEAPRGFQHLPDPATWVATLKSLFELHAQTIEGLTDNLEVTHTETNVGGAGEIQQDVQNVTRPRSEPVFTWTEKYGMPINAFLYGWITNLIMDPTTKIPSVMTRKDRSKMPTDLLPDYSGATCLFFEPDPTHTRVVKAWLSTNMRPTSSGEVVGSRDLTTPGDLSVYSVTFTALTQVGTGVKAFAQRYMDQMNLSALNPNLRPAFVNRIEADIEAAASGYQDQMDWQSATSIPVTDPNTPAATRADYAPNAGDSRSKATAPAPITSPSTRYRNDGV